MLLHASSRAFTFSRLQSLPIIVVVGLLLTQVLLLNNSYPVLVDGILFQNFRECFKLLVGSITPCYIRDRTQPAAEECESVVIPTGFCETCGVTTGIKSDGKFENCMYTSGVETLDGVVNMACVDKMQAYVEMNPCDTERARGLIDYRRSLSWPSFLRRLRVTGSARQIMDSFVYAVCELSCDCIPQFNASITQRALDFARGNCQGHVLYDVCQVYPNIKLVRGENGTTPAALNTNLATLDPVCPYIKEWRDENPGSWVSLTPTFVHPVVRNFLEAITEASEMITSANDTLWRQCFHLESTQKAIFPI